MTQVELRERLHEVDHRLRINAYDDGRDVYGIYFGNEFICSIPKGKVYTEKEPKYVNESGVPHRSLRGVYKTLKSKRIGLNNALENLIK